MFLLNSRLGLFSATGMSPYRRPFSRSYRTNLPSSLTANRSSALVYSTQPPVSVYGTGDTSFITLRGFSWELDYIHIGAPRRASHSFRLQLSRRICLPRSASLPFNPVFRLRAGLSLLRHLITGIYQYGNINPFVHRVPLVRVPLRPRLTLIRLALIRKP